MAITDLTKKQMKLIITAKGFMQVLIIFYPFYYNSLLCSLLTFQLFQHVQNIIPNLLSSTKALYFPPFSDVSFLLLPFISGSSSNQRCLPSSFPAGTHTFTPFLLKPLASVYSSTVYLFAKDIIFSVFTHY